MYRSFIIFVSYLNLLFIYEILCERSNYIIGNVIGEDIKLFY